ncbi:MAG: DUF3006 domain-containing protein [Acutalibacteraceae bacterium]|nr:DUF3006 domain-containing protein [Acutalibacteraceae bacterium]
MKTLIIERFENNFAICEDKDKCFFGIELTELPEGAKAGDVLDIDNNGNISINKEETERRKNRIKGKMQKLKNN